MATSGVGYSASSAKTSSAAEGNSLGGHGWVIDPDGAVLVETSKDEPFANAMIDLAVSEAAKVEYPRYVWARQLTRTQSEAVTATTTAPEISDSALAGR